MHAGQALLKEEQAQGVAMELQASLVELLDLSLKGKQAHWNVIGPGFITMHRLLDEFVAEYRDLADLVAERCVTVGVAPDGLAGTVAQASHLPDITRGRIQDRQIIEWLSGCLAEVCRRLRQRCVHVERIDPVTQNLLIKALAKLEKQHWMLAAKIMSA